MKKIYKSILATLTLAFAGLNGQAQLTENFDDITLLTGNGWFMQNNSTTIGSTNWFQGNSTVFSAFNGAATAYIGANFNNTTGANTISNWLCTPVLTIKNGDVVSFYTRKATPDTYPDRLQLRMSTNGASTNVGTGATAVGDFTTLLLDINPTLVTGVYPTAWTQYTVTISGLSSPMTGRFALRYFVTNGGPSGANSDYIGIDNFVHTPYVCPTLNVGPGSLPNATAGSAYSQNLSQTGALGTPNYAVTGGSLPSGLSLSTSGALTGTPTATGTFNFTVTVSDASGCTGSNAFSLTVVCPTGGASISSIPALCSNDGPYTLTQGSPAGGTYTGTGVTGNTFDPTAGSQTITYSVTDAYSCLQTATANITVNTPTASSFASLSDVCSNANPFALTGGSPAGGNYFGTGVSAGNFDPSNGTQNIGYVYIDGNGCKDTSYQTQTVHPAPGVSLTPFPATCNNVAPFALTGGSPAGGTYSGTGVSAGNFDPSNGTQLITYTYTDANNCTNQDTATLIVNPVPSVSLAPFTTPICQGASPVVLTGGSPSGGTYTGPGVSAGSFNPTTVGSFPITYSVTVNGCSDSATQSITVQNCTGISELNLASSIGVYPNPNNGTFTVTLGNQELTNLTISVISFEGKLVFETKPEISNGDHNIQIQTNNLSSGIYLLRITATQSSALKKISIE